MYFPFSHIQIQIQTKKALKKVIQNCIQINKIFKLFFSNKLFDTEGYSFFPGTYDSAYLLLTLLGQFKDQESLFDSYVFSPLLRDKIKDWSYGKLTCSVLYYYLNHKLAKNKVTSVDWSQIGDLIQSPAISRDIFSFLNQNNIVNFSSKSEHILGFMKSLIFPPFSSYIDYTKSVRDVRIYYRFLNLANVEKSRIRELIKIIITEQNRKAIVYFLENEYNLYKAGKDKSSMG